MTDQEPQVHPKRVFVVSPIGASGTETYRDADYALRHIFKKALFMPAWDVRRADESNTPDSIGQHVIKSIHDADLIIADLTGHNPNVFYELAIAHAWSKPVVHLIAEGQSVPFDIVDQRTIFYDLQDLDSVDSAIQQLRSAAEMAVGSGPMVTPVSSFQALEAVRGNAAVTTESGSDDAIAFLLEDISAKLSNLETRVGALAKNAATSRTASFVRVPTNADKSDSWKSWVGKVASVSTDATDGDPIRLIWVNKEDEEGGLTPA